MINLLLTLILISGSFGAIISKTTTDYGFRKQRQHTEPLKLDQNTIFEPIWKLFIKENSGENVILALYDAENPNLLLNL